MFTYENLSPRSFETISKPSKGERSVIKKNNKNYFSIQNFLVWLKKSRISMIRSDFKVFNLVANFKYELVIYSESIFDS